MLLRWIQKFKSIKSNNPKVDFKFQTKLLNCKNFKHFDSQVLEVVSWMDKVTIYISYWSENNWLTSDFLIMCWLPGKFPGKGYPHSAHAHGNWCDETNLQRQQNKHGAGTNRHYF